MGKVGNGPEYIPLDPPKETAVYLYDTDTQRMSEPPTTKTRLVCADHRRTCNVLRSSEFRYLNDETRGRLLEMVMSIPEGTLEDDVDPAVTVEGLVAIVASVTPLGVCCPHPIGSHPEIEGERFCVEPGCSCTAWRK